MKTRALLRVASVLRSHWEEARGVHSRLFGVLIPDAFVEDGQSIKGGNYREHIAPCVVIRDSCLALYDAGATVEEVAEAIRRHLRIVRIQPEEAQHLDYTLGLKERMPIGWVFGKDDPLARLHAAGIKLAGA